MWACGLGLALGAALFVTQRGPQVSVAVVTRKNLVRTILASGRVLAPAEVKVGALVSSAVVQVLVREGDTVRAGDLLVQLDDAAAKAQERQALAQRAEANAGREGVRVVDLPTATAQLEQARSRLELERKAARRATGLLAKQGVTQSEAEIAETNLRLAESQLRAAELTLASVSKGGSASTRAQALTAVAEAQLERARVEVSRSQIRAPADGIVIGRSVEPGNLVSPGTQLLTLSTLGNFRVTIDPDERSLATLQLNQKARVSSEAFPDESFEAVVSYIAPSVNARRGTVEVRLDIPTAPAYLRPDMTVSAEITVGEVPEALVVPLQAVHSRLDNPWVLVASDGHAKKRPVVLGVTDTTTAEVRSGLAEGEIVVQDAVLSLQDGQRVRPLRGAVP
jgi:HlyD family secretion protein